MTPRSSPPTKLRLLACAWLLAALSGLAGCASTITESLPTAAGGLPEGAPARAEVQPAYPAVHEMPPTRANAPLNEAEQKQLEADLIAARDRADGVIATGSAGKGKAAASAKKK
jgi:hypothetical protein